MNSTLTRGLVITAFTIAVLIGASFLRQPAVSPATESDPEAKVKGAEQIGVVNAPKPEVAIPTGSPVPVLVAEADQSTAMVTTPDGRQVAVPPIARMPGDLPAPMENPPGIFGRFNEWSRRYLQADPATRTALRAEGLALAAERRTALKALIQSDPEQALLVAVKESVVSGLPREVAELLEQHIHQVGKWEFLAYRPLPDQPMPPDFKPYRRFARLEETRREAFTFGKTRELTRSYERALISGVAIQNVMAVAEVLPAAEPQR